MIPFYIFLGVIIVGIGAFIFYKVKWGVKDRAENRKQKEENKNTESKDTK